MSATSAGTPTSASAPAKDQQGVSSGNLASSRNNNSSRVFRYDCIQKLSTSAPLWVVIQNFDCRDWQPQQTVLSSQRLLDLYANKMLNRSTCIAGLLNSTRPILTTMAHIPAAFFRPLEYLLELAESGSFYRPITPEDLQASVPPPHWCPPLHMQLAQHTSGGGLQQMQPQQYVNLQALATAAFGSAQHWCLVHRYQDGNVKADFNWTPRDLVAGLINKSVSPYTMVLGLDVQKDRNLPWLRQSLFMPLAAILHQHQGGLNYVPVSRGTLNLFNTLGYKQALATVLETGRIPVVHDDGTLDPTASGTIASTASGALSQPPTSAAALSAANESLNGPAHTSEPPSSGDLTGALKQLSIDHSVGRFSGQIRLDPGSGASIGFMNSGGAVDNRTVPLVRGLGAGNNNPVRSTDFSQRLLQLSAARSNPSAAQPGNPSPGNSGSLASSAGMSGFSWSNTTVQPSSNESASSYVQLPNDYSQNWSTSLFKLFSSNVGTTRVPQPQAMWWVLEASGNARGPLTAEQMMVGYVSGFLDDNSMVCGTCGTAVTPGGMQLVASPALSWFQPLGVLLRAMQGGAFYQLLNNSGTQQQFTPAAPAQQDQAFVLLQPQAQAYLQAQVASGGIAGDTCSMGFQAQVAYDAAGNPTSLQDLQGAANAQSVQNALLLQMQNLGLARQ